MSWTKPTSAIAQMDDREGVNESNNPLKTFSFKGPYSDLNTAMLAINQGDVISGTWKANSWTLTRIPGNWGRLEIECIPQAQTASGGVEIPKKIIWTLKSVRNDVSILGYINGTDFPLGRYLIEMWQKETSKELADAFSFKDDKGVVTSLNGYNLVPLAKKIASGIESVIRFYPILTKKTILSNPPASMLSDLATINIPSTSGNAKEVKAPGNLSTIIGDYQWLKCQDDLDEQQDNDFCRTESWMGIKTGEGSWDINLYGTGDNRWALPEFTT